VQKVWTVPARYADVVALADHLRCQRIERVVVESISDYWRIWFYLLEAAGLQVWLVNARDVKNVPGRPKTDRLDSVWTYVALDDLKTGQRVEELARRFDLSVKSDHVGIDGGINLNRPGLLVICGPRMSPAMREAYDKDPVLEWERDEVGWLLRDTRTGDEHRSGQEDDPPRPYDIGYLGRLPRPDGNGSFIAIAGVHPEGSLGVVHLLTTDIGSLWGQVGGDRFGFVRV
jgi:hypothetical protein